MTQMIYRRLINMNETNSIILDSSQYPGHMPIYFTIYYNYHILDPILLTSLSNFVMIVNPYSIRLKIKNN